MSKFLFIIPGDINLPTGGYRYDKAILEQWKNAGIEYELISLEGNYPFPSEEEKLLAMKQVNGLASADIAVIDGLAGGVLPEFIKNLSAHMPVVSLLHHPLCLENGLEYETAKALEVSEQESLKSVSHVITTSDETRYMVNTLFGIPLEEISSVLPGVNRERMAIGSGRPQKNLLCVGSIIERKGHKTLIQALSHLSHLNWHLDCVGAMDFDVELAQEIKALITKHELTDRVTLHGSVTDEAVSEAYHKADLFVLPSLYEGYGMVYAEAIVRGLPVIGTTAGAIPDTVPETCGMLVEPGNSKALAKAIEEMLSSAEVLESYKQGAIKAEPSFPTWQQSANAFYEILETHV